LLTITSVLTVCCQLGIAQRDDEKSLFEQGNVALRRGDAAEAVSDFQRFSRQQPNSVEGHFNLGLALQSAGQWEESLAELHKTSSLQPGMRGVRLFSGIANYKLNHLSTAHDELIRETQLEPKNAAGWMWLGVIELAQNHADAAAAALDKAAALDPTNLDILYHRARAHLLISKASFAAMFKLSPDSWRVHEVLGQADVEAQMSKRFALTTQSASSGSPCALHRMNRGSTRNSETPAGRPASCRKPMMLIPRRSRTTPPTPLLCTSWAVYE
jgi:tetratricopeptide (TPR) repeat protein